jgi:hypothetical protein
MLVTLRAKEPGSFKFDPSEADISRDTKLIRPGDHAEWHWVVTPLISGTKHIILHSVFIEHLADGSSVQDDQGQFETTITIIVAPWYVRLWGATPEFIAEHWLRVLGYFLPASGATILAAWWNKRKKKPRRRHP